MSKFFTDKDRLEAFSDGVLAVIITIMVLELRPPRFDTLHSLVEVLPNIALYALSFVFIGIYWNNHHHMLHASKGIDGAAMWANLHLLFWLSLVPFATEWLGKHPRAVGPTVLYGTVLLFDAIAYSFLHRDIGRYIGRGRGHVARAGPPVRAADRPPLGGLYGSRLIARPRVQERRLMRRPPL